MWIWSRSLVHNQKLGGSESDPMVPKKSIAVGLLQVKNLFLYLSLPEGRIRIRNRNYRNLKKFDPDSYRNAQKCSLLTWSFMQCCCYYRNLKSLIPTHTGMQKRAAHSHDPWCNAAVTIWIWRVWSRLICTKLELTHMILDAMLLLHMLGQQLQMAQAAWPKQHAAMLPAHKH